MGAWYIGKQDGPGSGMFREQHPGELATRAAGTWQVTVAGTWSGTPPGLAEDSQGRFLAVAGTLIHEGALGPQAAKGVLAGLVRGTLDWDELLGAYAAVYWDGNQLRVFTDPLGNVCVYRTVDGAVWSTSFLATSTSSARRTLNVQAAYEYVLLEAPFGQDTVCREVIRIAPEPVHRVDTGGCERSRARPAAADLQPGSLQDHVDRNTQALMHVFEGLTRAAHGQFDTALSAGYDSRLILALLRRHGAMPRLHVYGGDDDPDVAIARQICNGEGLALRSIDKRRMKLADDEEPREEIIRRNFLAFDGYALDGIFDAGADLSTRLERMADGYVSLNGGGGEVFRNFYYLPDRPFSTGELLSAFYSRFDPAACTERFGAGEFFDRLGAKLEHELDIRDHQLSRTDVERSYALFRCRFWMARNTSINTRLGRFLTPLVEPAVLATAISTPLRHKNHGRLESAMIAAIDPALAAYPSSYGRPFRNPPGFLERLKGRLSYRRPVWLRRNAYRIRQHLRGRPCSLLDDERARWVGQGLAPVRSLMDDDRLRDPAQATRLLNLAYLIDRLEVDTAV